ncbi:(NiFe) hydrogenase maturation protein HypF [Pleurocapsa sp. PCC 7327]|uniref:carbamoyltransferase HypF n=1 Tax=Pleurocapsa sp. PCC 7327 TaxID=118163 RepID=UPI00029FBC2F|nr:carbamoyltransferase HypF [Pleurocapsa sp. PCC 7327]AFY78851.1 (NiFe) hydrogenase maturation protein HypF [Pleurocapsa sp. PCC 7327]
MVRLRSTNAEIAEEIRVRGTVQGVGFRPTVYRLAKDCRLRGEVGNDGEGVWIYVAGKRDAIDTFVERLRVECPPLAKIEAIIRRPYEGDRTFTDFTIAESSSTSIRTEIAADAATCPACRAEIFDPFSRWYRYPFTNCTHCGPRLSIIKRLPYDRSNTSMAEFKMCPDCIRNYEDPSDRRFHAQPTACPVCGPKAWLERFDGKPITAHMFSMLDDVDVVCTLIQQGQIVAIKGLGGFHLACDATNEAVVQKLRYSKRRPDKPLALMARDINIIEKYCLVSAAERELLESPAAPIVLLQRRERDNQSDESKIQNLIAPSVAPGQNYLGFMLPYTPLHHLALKRLEIPIVLTSGNLSDEPQCIDNEDARKKLAGIADYFLFHNRDIVNRVDDSVVCIIGIRNSKTLNFLPKPLTRQEINFLANKQNSLKRTCAVSLGIDSQSEVGIQARNRFQILRRARGYAPAPINLPEGFKDIPPILAMGSQLKNTFCLLRDGQAILSQHIGDLENAAASEAYKKTLDLYLSLLEHQPKAIAIDLHPEYLSTKLGKELAAANSLKLYAIQHHHAHVAACMAENHLPIDAPPVLGIALDGLGYGEDGTLWGGEFLLADYQGYKRLGTFKPVAMLGGEQAIYQPWRNTYAHLKAAFGAELPPENLELLTFLKQKPLTLLDQMMEKGINSPLASSGGRLFDAVAAAIGICRESCSYEGQGAIALEAIAESCILTHSEEIEGYPFTIANLEGRGRSPLPYLEPRPMWQALLEDLKQDTPQEVMAAKFHQGLANAIASMVDRIRYGEEKINRVALTGGVFQNRLLLVELCDRLQAMGIQVLTHGKVPSNDGGLSLGQVAIAAARFF